MDNNLFTSYLQRLDNLQKNIREAMAGLPPEAIDWSPGAEMNSIAVLLAHTAGSLRYWIGDVVLDEPSDRVRESEFKTQGVSGQELLSSLDTVLAYVRTSLPRLSLSDLDKETFEKRDGKPVTRGWALLHALEHSYLHLGHIQLTSQLWKER